MSTIKVKQKDVNFIAGFVIAHLENKLLSLYPLLDVPKTGVEFSFRIPTLWVADSLNVFSNETATNETEHKMSLVATLIEENFLATFSKKLSIGVVWNQTSKRSHLQFYCILKPAVRKMTIEEIEQKLGYRIEIVEEK